MPEQFESIKKREIISWCFYDFANSAFTTLIVTVAYSVYFKFYVAPTPIRGDLLWGFAFSLSMLLVALSSPIFGAIADFSASKKRYLIYYTFISVFCTALLFFVKSGDVLAGIIFFIIANVGFEGAYVFYNGFLVEISTRQSIGKISGYGWALGYVGGLACLILVYPLIKDVDFIKGEYTDHQVILFRISFLIVALFFLIFSLPIFLFIKERAKRNSSARRPNYFKIGFQRLNSTFSHIKRYKEAGKFVIASLIYNDGITTLIAFSSIYAVSTLHFTMGEVTLLFIASQLTAFLGSITFGHLQGWIGGKKTINTTLVIWCFVCIGAFLAQSKLQFFFIALTGGFAMGSSLAVSRAFMGLFIPHRKEAEFYGFYILSGKFAAILGPFLFGAISSATGNQRFAVLAILIFFIAGLIIMCFINEEAGIRAARRDETPS